MTDTAAGSAASGTAASDTAAADPAAADTAATVGAAPSPESHARSRAFLRWCLRAQWRGLALAAVTGVVVQGLFVLLPWGVQQAVDRGITPGDVAQTAFWAVAVAGLGLLITVGQIAFQWWNYLSGARVIKQTRERLAAHVLELDRAALAGHGPGELAVRGGRDAEALWNWLSGVVETVQLIAGLAIILGALLLLDPLLAAIGLAVIPLLLGLAAVFPRRYEAASLVLGAAHGDRGAAVEGLLSGSAAVRGVGGEHVLVSRHHDSSAEVTRQTVRVARIGTLWGALASFVPLAAAAAGLFLGGLAAVDGDLTVGGLIAFASWMAMLAQRVDTLVGQQTMRRQAAASAARIAEVLALTPRLPEPADPLPAPPPGPAQLTGTGIRVAHGGRTVLDDIGIEVRAGETVAVTGVTGSGKTSLLRVLARLDAPDTGAITLDGVGLDRLRRRDVRARIGFVPQRPVLTSGTLRSTLLLGAEPTPDRDDEVHEACRIAAFDGDLAGFPDGLDTVVGEGGTTLSGGQVQRIALARALLRDPDVLLLDDVTSALDTGTENLVLTRLRAARPDLAIVFAGHREAVHALADRAVALPAPPVTDSPGSPDISGTVSGDRRG
ncbi:MULTISPECIES: ABC transporter ATP-binding protein [Pseudonocardia]|uniref:ABC transporter ATP-binding protein n=2 Tax=Pseudonocardia TaxID=1847 RepID=A0ABQ0RX30_9PSEU|nr:MULTISPECIES: ABC transporter ATP-binding protein [Pseudonocardia]OSY40605.1 putative multidrug resistance ABC transporter ATP-binding/permease protein YheI [Pseudonocardia autotrophica]TDN73598.1 ATP-binding cassette subfamily B protein [Pseudonocardia autotrophica]BBG04342.1 ABC transporter ATP-binding protein [Pseudonocardia autotrophica]GEC25208.1 ABC transporter ATP-binding protein [Pseudonocardia saturnea]